ncbi:MAG: type II secretion system protein [Clostridiaceae bacterium]
MKNKGFTLIELIIVITVISLLLTVIVPNYLYYKKRTDNSKAVSFGNIIFQETLSQYYSKGDIEPISLEKDLSEISNLEGLQITEIESNKFKIKFKVSGKNYSNIIDINKKTCLIKDSNDNEISKL